MANLLDPSGFLGLSDTVWRGLAWVALPAGAFLFWISGALTGSLKADPRYHADPKFARQFSIECTIAGSLALIFAMYWSPWQAP